MRLELNHDPQLDVWTLRHFDVAIRTHADIDTWRELLRAELGKLGGKRVDLLISLDGFTLDPSLAEAYGRVAKEVASQHTRTLIRYGSEADMTTTAIRLGAVLSRFPSNIFPDRRHALSALDRARELPHAKVP